MLYEDIGFGFGGEFVIRMIEMDISGMEWRRGRLDIWLGLKFQF